jgi:hypothetical protein
MLHNIENRLFFQEYKVLYLQALRSALMIYEQRPDDELKATIEGLQRTYEEIEPLYEHAGAPEPPSPDRLLSKEDQGVGRQEQLL